MSAPGRTAGAAPVPARTRNRSRRRADGASAATRRDARAGGGSGPAGSALARPAPSVPARPRRDDRRRRAAGDPRRPRVLGRRDAVGRRAPTSSRSAGAAARAGGSPTCSAGGGCSRRASRSSRPARSRAGSPSSRRGADRGAGVRRARARRSRRPPRSALRDDDVRGQPRADARARHLDRGRRRSAAPRACCSAACPRRGTAGRELLVNRPARRVALGLTARGSGAARRGPAMPGGPGADPRRRSCRADREDHAGRTVRHGGASPAMHAPASRSTGVRSRAA